MNVIYLLLLLVILLDYFDVNEIHFANINIILFTVFFSRTSSLLLFIQTDRLSDLLIIETLVDFSFQITSRPEVSVTVKFSNILFIFFSLNNFPQDEDHDHHGEQQKNQCPL